MLEQLTFDLVIVIGLFILRVGVPLAILYGVARWVERKLRPTETPEPRHRSVHGHA